MTEKRLKLYYQFVCDVWKLFFKYRNPRDNDSYWELLMDEAEKLTLKYGNTEFVRKITLQVVLELEKIYFEKKRINNDDEFN
ncbi:MAG: hypothetical protein K6G88_05780 [Lachnospiraceae bacterium]|nr:hypothetical protein [Lachnospiraceae bacterium]